MPALTGPRVQFGDEAHRSGRQHAAEQLGCFRFRSAKLLGKEYLSQSLHRCWLPYPSGQAKLYVVSESGTVRPCKIMDTSEAFILLPNGPIVVPSCL